jgi:carbonic anhydrase
VSVIDDLLRNAEAYAAAFDKSDLAKPPALKLAVVACMDARLNPHELLGLQEGDAHVIRNAGGVITRSEIRSLAVSQHLLGTEEIILLHHTDCGMLGFRDDEFAERLERETGERPTWSAYAITDIEQDVRDGIRTIRESPFLAHKDNVRGFVYDVKTGELREVS